MRQIDPNLLCPRCMSEKPSKTAVCPACGCDPLRMERNPRCLQPMSVLQGKYLIGAVLGEGGFGITYIGWDLEQQRKLAIKEYFPSTVAVRDTTVGINNSVHSISGDKHVHFLNGLKKFEDEAKNLMRLKDVPGIVEILDFFFENSTAYIVMEFLDGITLRKYMEKDGGCLSEKQTLEMLRPVMESLAKVHEAGMIHRDISPDNIMVLRSGEMKLIDFGAARISTGEETQSLTVILKHGYAPEEQYRSRGRQGPFTDVYAMSAVVYKLLTGVTPVDAMARVLEDELPPLSSYPNRISRQTIAAVEKGMAVRAENRYADMRQLIDALYNGKPAEGTQHETRSRRPWLWIGLGTGLAALAAVLAISIGTAGAPQGAVSLPSDSRSLIQTGEADANAGADADAAPDANAGDANAGADETGGEAAEETPPAPAVEPDAYCISSEEAEESGLSIRLENGCAVIVRLSDDMREERMIRIPDYIDQLPVTEIGREAFADDIALEYLTLPRHLKKIGDGAFSGCLSLGTLELPEELETIGRFSFYNCSALKAVHIPASVTALGEAAFSACMNLNELTLPEGLESIGKDAFSYCLFLRELEIPESVSVIGSGAFTGCDRLTLYYTPGSFAERYIAESDLPSEAVSVDE